MIEPVFPFQSARLRSWSCWPAERDALTAPLGPAVARSGATHALVKDTADHSPDDDEINKRRRIR